VWLAHRRLIKENAASRGRGVTTQSGAQPYPLFAAFTRYWDNLSNAVMQLASARPCLRRGSQVFESTIQPFSPIDFKPACDITGGPTSLFAIISLCDCRKRD
jgi:hypothetical protein